MDVSANNGPFTAHVGQDVEADNVHSHQVTDTRDVGSALLGLVGPHPMICFSLKLDVGTGRFD